MSAESGGGGCEWNTDGYPEANTFEAPSLCLSHFYFFLFFFSPTIAASFMQRRKLIGGWQSHGLMIRSAAWTVLTVAKVFWDGRLTNARLHFLSIFTCIKAAVCPVCDASGPRITRFLITEHEPDSLLTSVWAAGGCRQHLLLRFDLHCAGLLYMEHPSNALPAEPWQRLVLSAQTLYRWDWK